MIPDEPLVFSPVFKGRIWGGRKLETILGKLLPPAEKVGESWEVSDRPGDESVVACGRLKGHTLREILRATPLELLGPMGTQAEPPERFPLLIKFLDADDILSVQVHPDDARAQGAGDTGKTEAWVVVQADPGARMVRGLKAGTTRRSLAKAIQDGAIEPLLRMFPVVAGDCIACPPGMVHAIGKGVLVAEIQQNSDLTYRLYDWKRTDQNGKPRELHVEKALDCIRFGDPGNEFEGDLSRDTLAPGPWAPQPYGRARDLLRSIYFRVRKAEVRQAGEWAPIEGFQVLMVIGGAVDLLPLEEGAYAPLRVPLGGTVLLPSACRPCVVAPRDCPAATVLAALPVYPPPVIM